MTKRRLLNFPHNAEYLQSNYLNVSPNFEVSIILFTNSTPKEGLLTRSIKQLQAVTWRQPFVIREKQVHRNNNSFNSNNRETFLNSEILFHFSSF